MAALYGRYVMTNVLKWFWWGPIRARLLAEDPSFLPNQNLLRALTNVAVGIVWQLCLVGLPIYIVLREWRWAGSLALLLLATSLFLKRNWYDRLEREPETSGEPRNKKMQAST